MNVRKIYDEVIEIFTTSSITDLVTGSVFNNPYNGLTVRSLTRKSDSEENALEKVNIVSPSLGYKLCYAEYDKRGDFISNREKDKYASLEDIMANEGYSKVGDYVTLDYILELMSDVDEELKMGEEYEYILFLNVIYKKVYLVEIIDFLVKDND